MKMRTQLAPADRDAIRSIVEATGVFYEDEILVAIELVDDALARGERSDYRFLLADGPSGLVGYACYGHIACTASGFDLYWIAVRPDLQGKGAGREIMGHVQEAIRRAGGTRIYVETSGRAAYEPTRAFYEHCGYAVGSVLEDFYGPGDPRITYVKVL